MSACGWCLHRGGRRRAGAQQRNLTLPRVVDRNREQALGFFRGVEADRILRLHEIEQELGVTLMAARDFENDRKDSGDMGSGHTVTVLYEVVTEGKRPKAEVPGEWFTLNVRYKLPESDASQLVTHRARPSERLEFLPFASAVAEFGLLLRDPSATPEQSKIPSGPATSGDAQMASLLTSRRNWARGLRAPL